MIIAPLSSIAVDAAVRMATKQRTSGSLGLIQIFCKAEEAQLFENYLHRCRFATKVCVLSNGRRPFCKHPAQLIDPEVVRVDDIQTSTHLGVEVFLSRTTCREALNFPAFSFCCSLQCWNGPAPGRRSGATQQRLEIAGHGSKDHAKLCLCVCGVLRRQDTRRWSFFYRCASILCDCHRTGNYDHCSDDY